jgi:proline dehydrogenase
LPLARPGHRLLHPNRPDITPNTRNINRLAIGLASTTLLGSFVFLNLHRDTLNPSASDRSEDKTSLLSLIRTYAVYSLCSVPVLVDNSPEILSALMSVPGLRQITEAVVRATFFSQVSIAM